MHETGIADYGDIFEGSKIIEKLTGETMERARDIAIRMREAGYAKSIDIVSGELTRQLSERQRKLESGLGTVKTWVHRARRELVALLRERGVVQELRHAMRRI